MINATLRKLKYSELYERLFDQESDKESPTSLYNILLLAAIIGCMAIDTSICERGFSLMNMLKTAKRSRMGTPLLRMLMKICTLGEAWKDASQIPASEIVDVWREQCISGRYINSTFGERRRCWARARRWRSRRLRLEDLDLREAFARADLIEAEGEEPHRLRRVEPARLAAAALGERCDEFSLNSGRALRAIQSSASTVSAIMSIGSWREERKAVAACSPNGLASDCSSTG